MSRKIVRTTVEDRLERMLHEQGFLVHETLSHDLIEAEQRYFQEYREKTRTVPVRVMRAEKELLRLEYTLTLPTTHETLQVMRGAENNLIQGMINANFHLEDIQLYEMKFSAMMSEASWSNKDLKEHFDWTLWAATIPRKNSYDFLPYPDSAVSEVELDNGEKIVSAIERYPLKEEHLIDSLQSYLSNFDYRNDEFSEPDFDSPFG